MLHATTHTKYYRSIYRVLHSFITAGMNGYVYKVNHSTLLGGILSTNEQVLTDYAQLHLIGPAIWQSHFTKVVQVRACRTNHQCTAIFYIIWKHFHANLYKYKNFLTWYSNSMRGTMSQAKNWRNSSDGGRVDPSVVCSWDKAPLDTDLPASTSLDQCNP